MTTPTDLKSIGYDRLTKDYMASYDGNVIGYFPNYSAAEEALNDHILGLCEQGLIDSPLAALAAGPDYPEPDDDIPGADPSPGHTGWMRMPEGDILDADGMRVQLVAA